MTGIKKIIIQEDPWSPLKTYTAARIALGRTGTALPLEASLEFRLAHAHARDAVYSVLQTDKIAEDLKRLQMPYFLLHSKANNRHTYLQRPDYGRQLNDASVLQMQEFKSNGFDIAVTIADGLSATAVNEHAIPVLEPLIALWQQSNVTIAPICICEEGRVAISDETGSLLKATLSLIFIGERPGLSSPDSLGAYLTYAPAVGTTDEKRNCVSNIRPQGLGYAAAADKIFYLVKESLRVQLSGVQLKDNAGLLQ